jgi:hypothetical protein
MNVNEITDDDLRKIANCAVPTVAEVCALAQAERSRREAVPVVCLDCGKTHEGNCCNTSEAKEKSCSNCGKGPYGFAICDTDHCTPTRLCSWTPKPAPPAKVTEPWIDPWNTERWEDCIQELQRRVEALEGRAKG